MPAGNVIFACKSVTHGSLLAGATHVRFVASTSYKIDPGGCNSPGDADCLVTDKGLAVEIYGNQFSPLLGRVGQAKASAVVEYYGSTGATKTGTITNVMIDEIIAPVDIPAKDTGGKIAPFGVRGTVMFGDAQGFSDVLSVA